MLHSTAPVLFESTDAVEVQRDPANEVWLAVVAAVCGALFDVLARRYYAALYHFRQRRHRAQLQNRTEVVASSRQQALEGMLEELTARKASRERESGTAESNTFVEAGPDREDESLPEALRDFSKPPPPLKGLLSGPGRPPADALCLMRAFLAAPLLGVDDSPTSVFNLLHSNPTFARACDFLGRDAMKQPDELTSRRLPSRAVCEEFSEVMTRYGLWQLARLELVRENVASGVVEIEDTLAFDTTHIEANSHCGKVVPPDAKAEEGKKPKQRKVPRMRKTCDCGKERWDSCGHPWTPTDDGAAVVVKGPTRVYWAHKASVVSLGDSEIPIDARALQYAAEHDGKTLVPHLELLERDLPGFIEALRHVLADDAYRANEEEVRRFGQQARLHVPVHPNRRSKAELAATFDGINRFTPIGVPVCEANRRFQMWGRDLESERYIWAAPDDEDGNSVCSGCPFASTCLRKGTRRHIRIDRADFPQIDWAHPQHFARNRTRYQMRTGVERAIKRLKVDLRGEHLTHRDGQRVQAHLDRKLLTLHLLLKVADTG